MWGQSSNGAMLILLAFVSATAAPVTFKVGLGGRALAPEGLHLAGSFWGWDVASTALADADLDGVYEVTLEVAAGRHEFKFINGNTWEAVETVPEACSELDSNNFNRYISVATDDTPQEVNVCFGACQPCGELPKCKQFNCAAGSALKTDTLEYAGSSQDTCCEQASDMGVVVRSAGWADGNRAEFWMNGVMLYATGTRGLTIVEMLPNGTVTMIKTFDTYSDSTELESYLSSVLQEILLVGAVDDASTGLSPEAKRLLAQCGAALADGIAYRSSYALICRGGTASAEVLSPSGSGGAVAVARLPHELEDLPFCNTRVAEPPMSGTLQDDGNFQLDVGCRYRVWQGQEAAAGLEGSWVVVTGSSNALLMWNSLLMTLAPSEAGIMRSGRFGGAHLLDAVIEDGRIIHYETVRSWLDLCDQRTASGAEDESLCRLTYAETLAKAPAHNGRRIRLTMFLSFYWARTSSAMELVEGSTAWAAAEVSMLVQVVAWYVVCNGIKFSGCHRPALIDLPQETVEQMFDDEMALVLQRMVPFCSSGGRAGVRGCAVATNSFTNAGEPLLGIFNRFNQLVTQAMQPLKTDSFRYVDIFQLGASMPDETVNGHGSQILQLWTWQMLLGGFCSPSTATAGSHITFVGPLCWRDGAADLDTCKSLSNYTGGVLWQCINSRLCTMRLAEVATTEAVSTTTTMPSRFEPVDGGQGRACRGDSPADNSASYYTVMSATSLEVCKELCLMEEECLGIEFSGRRCELWNRPVLASIALDGFTCMSVARTRASTTTTTNTIALRFQAVDGGTGRACRGATPSDNNPSNYELVSGIFDLVDCQAACLQAPSCVGIEFSAGRCEVWTRADGIQASIALDGFTCMSRLDSNQRRLFLAPRRPLPSLV